MAFSTDMQSTRSHKALLAMQDSEIRFLEMVKKCTAQRIKCDREYATALSAILSAARKHDMMQYHTPTSQVTYIILFLQLIIIINATVWAMKNVLF